MRIIGCGNRDRGDDGAGILVAERLRSLGVEADIRSGEGLELLEAWRGIEDCIVVDAVSTGAPAGTIRTWEAHDLSQFPSASLSTHGFGVAEAIRLAIVLGCLPRRLRIYGIEGGRFDPGVDPTPEVSRAIEQVAGEIARVAGGTQR